METPETGAEDPSETPGGGVDETPGEARADPAPPVISIVVPAYNEADRIGPSVRRILDYSRRNHPASEIIVVDDGSVDGTAGVVAAFLPEGVRIISNATNHGKGYAVRRGFLAARGEWVLFTDTDLSAPIEELDRLLEAAREGADVVIGSRAIDRSMIAVHQPRVRELGGIFFNWMVQMLLGLRLKDTQCVFKLFRREPLEPVFQKQRVDGFAFDPEILFLARRRGLSIREVPVRWSHASGSKIRFLRDGLGMFLALARIRWNALSGKYR